MPHPGSQAPATASICALVVTYRPAPEVVENLRALVGQVRRLIVVDNESTPESRALLVPIAERAGVEVHWNATNRGLAAALNQGVARALESDCEWIATFDQDSTAPADFCATLWAGLHDYAARDCVAVVAPLYRDRHLGLVYSAGARLPADPPRLAAVSVAAASGNLVSVAALRAVGGFREDFFIAGIDFEFCLRCRRAGWQILEVRDAVLEHAMGRYETRHFLGREVRFNDYSVVRRYYHARNLTLVLGCGLVVDPIWAVRAARDFVSDFVKLLLFGCERGAKVRAVMVGLAHAALGYRGRWTPESGRLGAVSP